jgi:hypothetical protein
MMMSYMIFLLTNNKSKKQDMNKAEFIFIFIAFIFNFK